MIFLEKHRKIKRIMEDHQFDALILGGTYNVQYASGIHIPCAHAQKDQIMCTVFIAGQDPVAVVPACWAGVARQSYYFSDIRTYGQDRPPLEAAAEVLAALCKTANRIGMDDEDMAAGTGRHLKDTFGQTGATCIPCASFMEEARALKTEEETTLLKSIAYKTDHVINGHFHHMSADRPKTASLTAESLRVHSSERDIPIAGYNASARAVLGESMSKFWAYAPRFGFADCEMTQDGDAIIAEVLTAEDGYWSNSTRIGISNDRMSDEQEIAYEALNTLRGMLLSALRIGRKCADVYQETAANAEQAGLPLVKELCLGFCVGVSPKEGPYISPGDRSSIEKNMVLVLDPVVKYGSLFYRSRDTVVITEDGPEIVNWYKDWREPYLAILSL